MDRGAWRATVHGVTKSQRRLSDYHLTPLFIQKFSLHASIYTRPMLNTGQQGLHGGWSFL